MNPPATADFISQPHYNNNSNMNNVPAIVEDHPEDAPAAVTPVSYPDWACCPVLVGSLMRDPVLIQSVDGCMHTVSHQATQAWYDRGHRSCPVCGSTVLNTELRPNAPLRDAIAAMFPMTGATGAVQPQQSTKTASAMASSDAIDSFPHPGWLESSPSAAPPAYQQVARSIPTVPVQDHYDEAIANRAMTRPLPDGARFRLQARLFGHAKTVSGVCGIDSDRVLSASLDRTLRLWQVSTQTVLQVFLGHTDGVKCCSTTDLDSALAISGSKDKTLKLWELASGRCLSTLVGHTDVVNVVLGNIPFRRSMAVSGSADGTLRVWDLSRGDQPNACVHVLRGHKSPVTCAAVLPPAPGTTTARIVSGSSDCNLKIWDIDNGVCLRTLEGNHKAVFSVAALDYNTVVSGANNTKLRVWNVSTGETLSTLKGLANWSAGCLLLDGGAKVCSSKWGRHAGVWDLSNGQERQEISYHYDVIHCIASFDQGWKLVSGGEDRQVLVYSI